MIFLQVMCVIVYVYYIYTKASFVRKIYYICLYIIRFIYYVTRDIIWIRD